MSCKTIFVRIRQKEFLGDWQEQENFAAWILL
jgi:hypothetical protein